MADFLENFTDTPGTLVQNHTSDSGHTWTKKTNPFGATVLDAAITQYGRASVNGATGTAIYQSSYDTGTSANYDIEGTIVVGNDAEDHGVLFCWDGANQADGIYCGYFNNGLSGFFSPLLQLYFAFDGFGPGAPLYFSPPWTSTKAPVIGSVIRYKLQRRGGNPGSNGNALCRIWFNDRLVGQNNAFFYGHNGIGFINRSSNELVGKIKVRLLDTALAAGKLHLGVSSPGTVSMFYTDGEGGNGNYTNVLQRCLDSGFASGVTTVGTFDSSLFIQATLPTDEVWYFRVVTTDGLGATATSVTLATQRPKRCIRAYGAGDSFMAILDAQGAPPGEPERFDGVWPAFIRSLPNQGTCIQVINDCNYAVGGTKTADWPPASTHLNNLDADAAAYEADIYHNPSGSETWVFIHLGLNDAFPTTNVSVVDYIANMSAIVSHETGAGRKVCIFTPAFCAPIAGSTTWWNPASDALLQQYITALAALDNGTDTIVVGSSLNRSQMAARQQLLLSGNDGDNLHPGPLGMEALGQLWAREFVDRLYGSGGATTVQNVRFIGSSLIRS